MRGTDGAAVDVPGEGGGQVGGGRHAAQGGLVADRVLGAVAAHQGLQAGHH